MQDIASPALAVVPRTTRNGSATGDSGKAAFEIARATKYFANKTSIEFLILCAVAAHYFFTLL